MEFGIRWGEGGVVQRHQAASRCSWQCLAAARLIARSAEEAHF